MTEPTGGQALCVGHPAPEVDLLDQHGQGVRLSAYAGGKAVLVVFFPFAFSGICTNELVGLRDRLGEFETDTTTVVAISCDSIYTQRAVADRDGIFFPLLADFWPHGAVARAFGVFDDVQGCAERSSFVVGKDGRIAWAVHSPRGQARDLDEHAARLGEAG